MRKKIRIVLLMVFGLSLLLFTIYWFSTSKIRSLNNHWGIKLPYSVDIVDFDASSAMSEGHAYYVIDLNGYDLTEEDVFDIEYDIDITIQENYESIIELCQINDTAEIDWDTDIEWTIVKRDSERLLIIVYNYGEKAVIIKEKW